MTSNAGCQRLIIKKMCVVELVLCIRDTSLVYKFSHFYIPFLFLSNKQGLFYWYHLYNRRRRRRRRRRTTTTTTRRTWRRRKVHIDFADAEYFLSWVRGSCLGPWWIWQCLVISNPIPREGSVSSPLPFLICAKFKGKWLYEGHILQLICDKQNTDHFMMTLVFSQFAVSRPSLTYQETDSKC